MHRSLLSFALSALCIGFAYGAEPTLYEAMVGQTPVPRKLNPVEQQYWIALVKAGLVPAVPKTVEDPTPVKINKLSERDAENLLKSLELPIDNLPAPKDTLRTVSPGCPKELRRNGETAHVLCIFEVTQMGSVGRVFSTEWSHESYFEDCAKALKSWTFKPDNRTHFYKIRFEATLEVK